MGLFQEGGATALELGVVGTASSSSSNPKPASEATPTVTASFVVCRVLPKVSAFILFMMLHDYLQEQLQFQFQGKNLQLPSIFTFLDVLGCCAGPFLSATAVGSALWPHHLAREDITQTFIPLALITITGIALANASLPLVAYPVKVTVKSFKLVPTMIFASIMLPNRRYSYTTYGAALLLCLGLAQFLRADHSTAERPSSPRGVLYIVLSCCADAVAPVLQDKAMTHHKTDPMFVMMFTNTVGVILVGVVACLMGEMAQAYTYFIEEPGIAAIAMLYASSTFFGVFAYMLMVKEVGGVGTTLVSTLRKILTVVLSFAANGHRFSWEYASGGGMVVAALLISKLCKKASA